MFTEFQTPEEFFLGKAPVKFQWLSADPQKILKKAAPVGPLEYHKKVGYIVKALVIVYGMGQGPYMDTKAL